MNDTEEVARRLFATAAEDIPPGIDLLRGVRARHQARRLRTQALISAGAAVVLAAAAVTLTVSRAPSALAQVAQAASRTSGQSYRASATTSLLAPAGSPAGTPATVSGEFDPAHGLGVETSARGQVRYVGGYMYVPMPQAFRLVYQRQHKTPLPAGKTWLRLKLQTSPGAVPAQFTAVYGSLAGLVADNPQSLLAMLTSATQVHQAGSASGPDWTGTRYAFTATTNVGTAWHVIVHTSGTVDVDQQGRVRRLDVRVRTQYLASPAHQLREMVQTAAVTFGDFGIGVSVSAPPASETYEGGTGTAINPIWLSQAG
jgi:hypothetical protein